MNVFLCVLLFSAVCTALHHDLPRADVTIPLTTKRVPKGKVGAHKTRFHAYGHGAVSLDGGAFETLYLVNVTVGAQNFQVQLDTGSSDFWVARKDFSCLTLNGTTIPSSACNFGPSQFDPSLSPTFQPMENTTFFVQYGSGEFLSGLVGFDTISIGGVSVEHQEFGVPDQNAFLGDGVTEGILGMAFAGLTSVYNVSDRHQAGAVNHIVYDPFFISAVKQGKVNKPYFSHSLDRPTREEQENDPFVPKLGLLSLGGIVPVATKPNSTVTLPVIGYAPDAHKFLTPSFNISSPGYRLLWYSILVDGYIFPGSRMVQTKSNATFFDSGTRLNLLPSDLVKAYNTPWAVFNTTSGLYVVDCNESQPPPFSVVLGGKRFTVDSRDLVVPLVDRKDSAGNVICISGIQDGGAADGEGNNFILGDVFLHNVVLTHNVKDAQVSVSQREAY